MDLVAWLKSMQEAEPSVMAPIPTRARAAAEKAAKGRPVTEFVESMWPLGFVPSGVGQAAYGAMQAAPYLAGEKPPLQGLAELALALATRSGPSKMSILGEASRAAPKKLQDLKEMLKAGVPEEVAYKKLNMLPLLKGGRVEDAWVPVMPPRARPSKLLANMLDKAASEQSHVTTKTNLGSLYDPAELGLMKQHYPDILDIPVEASYGPNFNPGGKFTGDKIIARARDVEGRIGLPAILAHEGTHALQAQAGLPQGTSPESTRLRLRQSDFMSELAAETYARYGVDKLFSDIRSGTRWISPGKHPPELEDALKNVPESIRPAVKEMAQWLAWQQRMQKKVLDVPFRTYRGTHGEQAAEAAGMNAMARPLAFTTPLSKQLEDPAKVGSIEYLNQIQRLADLKKMGLFDPSLRPYSLPPP